MQISTIDKIKANRERTRAILDSNVQFQTKPAEVAPFVQFMQQIQYPLLPQVPQESQEPEEVPEEKKQQKKKKKSGISEEESIRIAAVKELEDLLNETITSAPLTQVIKPRKSKNNFIRKDSFVLNTSRIILESFNPSFKCIDAEKKTVDFLIVDIEKLAIGSVVEALKEDKDSIILIYSENIASHKKNFLTIEENLFSGFKVMYRNLCSKKAEDITDRDRMDFEFVKEKRANLFNRLFLMSVQKGGGFGFPMLNGLLLFFSVLIHGKPKSSDFEYLMSDPDLGDYEIPAKRLIIENEEDGGKVVCSFLKRNFLDEKKKIYYITDNFYLQTLSKKSFVEYEHLRILLGITKDKLDRAVAERDKIINSKEDHRKKVLSDMTPNYRGKVKTLLDAYFDPNKSRAFSVKNVNPAGYKLCHNIINYVDYISGSKSGDTLFRFFDIIPPAMFYLKHDTYLDIIIKGYLENHPRVVDQSWFGKEFTYAQTEKFLDVMTSRKLKLDDVFEDILLDFEDIKDEFKGKYMTRNQGDEVTVACYIFIGGKYTGKTFLAKRFTEYLDDAVGKENVTIINEYKAKLNAMIGLGKKHIVIDSPMLNKEYNRRRFKVDMSDKIGTWVTVEYIFINVNTINAFRNMLIKYTKSAYPTEYSSSHDPKGYFQSNLKNKNVVNLNNCFWDDASRETFDFSFEISRQIH